MNGSPEKDCCGHIASRSELFGCFGPALTYASSRFAQDNCISFYCHFDGISKVELRKQRLWKYDAARVSDPPKCHFPSPSIL